MHYLTERIRFFNYIAGVLENQCGDPLCCRCKAHTNTLSAIQEGLEELKNSDLGHIPAEEMDLLEQARNRIYSIKTSGSKERQKKAGNCKMPKGVCFVKSSKAVLNNIAG
jgi:hypothetical protein